MTEATEDLDKTITYLGPARAESGLLTWQGQGSLGLTELPADVLAKHDARMLDPTKAPQLPGFPARFPTAYRTADLLVSPNVRGSVPRFNEVLREDLGLALTNPNPDNTTTYRWVLSAIDETRPAVVDAWLALQTLRAATMGPKQRLTKDEVAHVGMNHLLVGAAMGGIGGASGVLRGVPGAVGGNPYPDPDVEDLGYWRRPVLIRMPAAVRRPDNEVGRRPVIAVLDTGIGQNTWLGVSDTGSSTGPVHVDTALQRDIETKNASSNAPSGILDDPYTSEPLTGRLSTHAGHGTFIMGIIQQIEPDANVLSVRVMHNDGVASSDVIAYALRKLHDRVVDAQDNNLPDLMVDVVSCSIGGYLENDFGTAELSELTKAIDDLRDRGVVVVASAGNYASSRQFWPAALAGRSPAQDPRPAAPPVISVGALNPNLTKALFSNDGNWVRCWAPGAALVSTFPETTNASRNPTYRVRSTTPGKLGIRESLEGDDYIAGFAEWSGTSFATPMVAARIAKLLLGNPRSDLSPPATLDRAFAAVAKI